MTTIYNFTTICQWYDNINNNISAWCIFHIFVLSINLIIIINSIIIHNFTIKFCELMIILLILLLNYNNDIKFCSI